MIFTFFDSICYFFLSFIDILVFYFFYYLLHKKIPKIVQKKIFHVCARSLFPSYLKKTATDYESKTNLLYSNFGHICSLVSTVLCVPSFGLHFIEALVFLRWRVTQVKLSFEGDSFLSFFWFPYLVEGGRRQSHCGIPSISQKKENSFFKYAYWYPGNWRTCTMCKRSV